MRIALGFVALALAVAACTDGTSKFVGRWSYYDTNVTTRCTGQADQTAALVGTITLSRVDGHTIAIDTASQYTLAIATSGDCAPRFTVSDMQADLVPQSSCALVAADGTQLTLDYSEYQLKLADVTGPGLAPMTPGLGVLLSATVSSPNGTCMVDSDGTVVTAS